MIARWVEHHLVDDHVLVSCRIVAGTLCILGHGKPFAAAVRKSLHRALTFGTFKHLRLQYRIAIEQIDRYLAPRLKVHRDNVTAATRRLTKQRYAIGKITPRGHRQAVQIHSAFAAVIKFHPVNGDLTVEVHLIQTKCLTKRRTANVCRGRCRVGEQKPLGAPARLATDRAAVQRHISPNRRHHGLAIRLRQINRHR